MEWILAGDGARFAEQAKASPGWYWVFRPHNVGPQAYDTSDGILFLVYVDGEGNLLSPLADFRSFEDDTCFDADAGRRYATWFAGPIAHNDDVRASIKAELGEAGLKTEVKGTTPRVPGWHWVRTNDEAPLILVDDAGVGPIFLDKVGDDVHVFLATSRTGNPIDVGEFGFSEPLVSAGGVIDSSGTLNRNRADFFGPLPVPGALPDAFPTV